jgi:hypothetical protein
MTTAAHVEHRTHQRSLVGSILVSLVLALLVALALELVVTAFAPLNPPAQALARGSEGFVALERQITRSGTLLGYPLQF